MARLRALSSGRFVRELLWVAASRITTAAVRLAGIRILTELIEPAVFGLVGLTIGMAFLATNILCAPILEASFRFYADAAREGRVTEHRRLLGGLLRTRSALAVGALLLGGLAWGAWRGEPEVAWSFAAVALLIALETQRFFELRLLNASRRQALHASWTLLDEILRLACASGAVLLLGPEAVFVLAGYAVGVAAGTAVFWRFRVLGESMPRDFEWRTERQTQVVRYALPLSVLAIVTWLSTFSDRYILAAFVGAESTGIYVAAYGLASQPFIMTSLILALTFRPVYNESVVHGDRRSERRVFLTWLLLLTSVLSAGVILMTWLAEALTNLLLAEGYGGAAALLPWIAAAYGMQGCKQVFEALVYAQRRTKLLLVVEMGAAAVSVGLYVALIPSMGALGAAIGTLGGMSASFVAMAFLSGAGPRLLHVADR